MREEYLDWSQSKVFLVIINNPNHPNVIIQLQYVQYQYLLIVNFTVCNTFGRIF